MNSPWKPISPRAGMRYSRREPLAQLAAADEPALAPGERRGVDEEVHGQRRLVDLEQRQSVGLLGMAQRGADAHLVDAVHQHDVTRFGFLHRHALETLEAEH